MATLKNRLKESLNSLLRPLGWELERRVPFGRDLFEDCATLSRGRAFQMIFDVGGHHGETTREFSKRYPQAHIHVFEPFRDSFEELRKATAGIPNVTAVNAGLGDQAGATKLYLNLGSATNSVFPNSKESGQYQPAEFVGEEGTAEIQLMTLDAYCERQKINFIDLLKIDAQGSELRILRGAQRKLAAGEVALFYCEILFVSLYDGQPKCHEIQEFLESCGFCQVGFYDVAWNEQHRMMWCEGLFFHPGAIARRFGPSV